MDLIAENGHRKWAYDAARGVLITAVTAIWLGVPVPPAMAAKPLNLGSFFDFPPRHRVVHRAGNAEKNTEKNAEKKPESVPLPRPRPAEAPAAGPEAPAAETPKPAEQAAPAAPPVPQPSACRTALTEQIAIAPSIPDIHGPGGCGGTDLVRLEAIMLPDQHRVAVTPPATLRCTMAAAIADWVRTDIAPLTQKLGSEIAGLDNFDSYECRGFNRIPGAHLSEHGRANALDVRGFRLADGRSIELTDRNEPRELRENVLHSVCSRFVTVLGPGSDGYHEEHIHLDLMEHQNHYRICHWEVYDPLPKIAPLMPAERPPEAPPRNVAGKDDDKPNGKDK